MMHPLRSLSSLCLLALAGIGSAQFSIATFEGAYPPESHYLTWGNRPKGLSADGNRFVTQLMHSYFTPQGDLISYSIPVVFNYNGGWTSAPIEGATDNIHRAEGISGNGQRLVGSSTVLVNNQRRSLPALLTPVSYLPWGGAYPYSIVTYATSHDGTFTLGEGSRDDNADGTSENSWVRWGPSGYELFAKPYPNGSLPVDLSADGSVFACSIFRGNGHGWVTVRYRNSSGMNELPKPEFLEQMFAEDVSDDGSTIVGRGDTYQFPGDAGGDHYAWYHNDLEGTVVVPLTAARPYGKMFAVNGDGTVMAGLCHDGSTQGASATGAHPFIWTRHSGAVDLYDYLAENGVNPGTTNLGTPVAMSANGRTLLLSTTSVNGGRSEARPVVVRFEIPQGLVSLRGYSDSVVGGNTAKLFVTLFKNAAASGESVELTSSNPAVLAVPANVAVAAGGKTGVFNVTTSGVAEPTAVTVKAKWRNVERTVNVLVKPASVKSVSVSYNGSPDPLDAGRPAGLTVLLDGKAPAGGRLVKVWDNTTLFSLPASLATGADVVVPEGETFGRLQFTTKYYAEPITKSIYAQLPAGGFRATTNLSLKPWYVPISLNVLPSRVIKGGESATGRLVISLPGGAGQSVTLTTGSNLVQIPSTVVVGPGDTAEFTISTSPVSASVNTWIRATLNGSTRSATIKITP